MKYYVIELNGEDVEYLPGTWTDEEIQGYLNEFYEDDLDNIEILVTFR